MVGSVAPSARSNHGEDRFYHPPQKRLSLQTQGQAQGQAPPRQQQRRAPQPQRPTRPRAKALRDAESRSESDDSSSRPSASVASSPSPPLRPPLRSNLERFLDATTPLVWTQFFSKRGPRGTRHLEASGYYFMLRDLWDAFSEWSAYGAGVPLVLQEDDEVVQYYVPYLSGIQLYVRDSSGPPQLRARHPGECYDGELSRDINCEVSIDCGVDRRSDRFYEVGGRHQIVDQLVRLSLGDKGRGGSEVPYVVESDFKKEASHLAFEYFERDSPYTRQPLADKMLNLVSRFPDLETYKSSDLDSSSWLSVAWYPIYRIPTGPTLKDLDACFLTFHTLSTPSKTMKNGYPDPGSSIRSYSVADLSAKCPLSVFGLASYKFKDSIWNSSGLDEQQQASTLLQAADDWLKKVQADLPDFRFFTSHGNYRR